MSDLEVAIPGNFPSPGKSPSLQRNEGRSQSLVSEMLLSPPDTRTVIMYLSMMGKAFLLPSLKEGGHCLMLGAKRWLF